MSLHEASKHWPQTMMERIEEASTPPAPMTAVEQAEALVSMAKQRGAIDRSSSTWIAVSSWAARQIIEHRAKASGVERDAKIQVLLELLAITDRVDLKPIIDPGPDVP